MLGLGNNVHANSYSGSSSWTPASLSNLTLWLAFNQNITADQAADKSSITHSTTAGDMVDQDKINAWNAFGDTSINAVQTTEADKPMWEADAADVGSVNFHNGSKYMNLSENIVLDANTDFTIALRFKPDDFTSRVFFGDSTSEFVRLQSNTVIRLRVNSSNTDFTLASSNIATDKYITLLIVRSDGATGNVNLFVRGADSGYFDGTATGTQFGSEAQVTGEITLSNLGSSADDAYNMHGFIKDMLVWDGTAASSADREQIFDYIEGQ